jgi:Zn-dependent protease with chaperone function
VLADLPGDPSGEAVSQAMTWVAGSMPAPAVDAPNCGPSTLILQSATAMRFALVIAAMLSTGLFIGASVFGATHGSEFAAAGSACLSGGTDLTSESVEQALGTSDCLAPLESEYARYAVGGAALVAAGALLAVAIAPSLITRRRSLRPLGPKLRLAEIRVLGLCVEAGLRSPPRLLVGRSRQRDAFCFGLPGRYMIALPPVLAISPDSARFDAVIRHEIAHIRHHDVAFAWLTKTAWYVLAPLLVIPAVLFLVTGGRRHPPRLSLASGSVRPRHRAGGALRSPQP